MPTENERKYVVAIPSEPEIADAACEIRFIRQAYLAFSKGLSVRVRETTYSGNRPSRDDHPRLELCFKQNVRNRVIEVEKKIDKRDFDDLWEISVNRLEKIRYIVEDKKVIWEVDYFKEHHQQTYFAMAEIEMPENQLAPSSIPAIIKKHLVFEVPATDDRFASKRIADVKYSRELYSEVMAIHKRSK
jgi:CYTH domain-containing protein